VKQILPYIILFLCVSCISNKSSITDNNETASTEAKTDTSTCLVFTTRYNGKNIYIQNPFIGTGQGFCVTKVEVNGKAIDDQISSSAFEIKLSNLELELGDSVVMKIYHKGDCQPKMLNPEPISRKSTYNIEEIEIINDSLKWTTTNEESPMTFLVEQFRWCKWLKVGEQDGVGIDILNSYSVDVSPFLTTGINKFRVKQIDYSGVPRISPVAIIETDIGAVKILSIEKKTLNFSEVTMYEVYDFYGNMVKKGMDNFIDLSNLEKGQYKLNYDSIQEQIISYPR
jgi:hypothetical protein